MNLQQRDEKVLWHAYTQHKTAQPPITIVKAKDALLWDENGKEYIDAIASWWVNPYGHANEQLAQVAYKQLTELEHILFGGFTHRPAIELSEKLLSLLPDNQSKVFFSDNGSTAVEVAIKMALQYYYNQSEKRTKIIAFENAFHGDTFAAMAASGISLYTEAFKDQLLEVIRIPAPTSGNEEKALQLLENTIDEHQPAGFIFEPLVQGAAGMVMHSPKALDSLIALCKKKNVLTIADEVMTGFGKTGKNFACDYLNEQPDIICLSKALTGGTIPLAVTTATQAVFEAFYDDEVNKALFHGHTFMANPTACAIALESIKILETNEMQVNIKRIHQKHLEFSGYIGKHPKVKNPRTLGVITAFDLKVKDNVPYYGEFRDTLYNFFIENGVILRPVSNSIYILSPYIISNSQLEKVYEIVEKSIGMLEEKGFL